MPGGLPTQVSVSYQFDAIGNIAGGNGVTYTYGDPAHPSAVTATSNGFVITYDPNGNMLTGTGRQGTWDADNRLIATSIQGGNSATFAYDFTGRRVRKQTLAGVTRYPFPGYEIDASGVTKFLFVGGQRAVAKKPSGQKVFYHNDHLGGVNVISDATGVALQLVEYEPWGMVTRAEGATDTKYAFNGRELDDPEMGLLYYGARYYSAALGRFISPDPTVPNPAEPQSLNRYSYVENDPVNHTDPSGLKKKKGFFSRLLKSFVRAIPAIVTAVVVAAVVVASMGSAVPLVVVGLVAGLAAGAAAGAVNTAVNGGDLATNILLGAAMGAISGAIAPGLSAALAPTLGGFGSAVATGAILGGAMGGAGAAISGGNILEGIAGGTVFKGDAATGADMTPKTARALAPGGSYRSTTTMVSTRALDAALSNYAQNHVGNPYNPLFQNSNYFVNSVVSQAGGNPMIPGGGFAPAFDAPSGPVPYLPVMVAPDMDR